MTDDTELDLGALARRHAGEAFDTLVDLLEDADCDPEVRVAAAGALLDLAQPPPPPLDLRQAVLAVLQARRRGTVQRR